jgi:hypothetical protein
MIGGNRFRERIAVALDSRLSGPEARKRVANTVRGRLQELISTGQAPPHWMRTVDGRRDAPEETVRLNGGTISYLFNILATASAFALEKVVARSPVESGIYQKSWVILVNGKPWTELPTAIPSGAEVVITNTQPYHRKINQAGQVTHVPPYIVQDVIQQTRRRFPSLNIGVDFVLLPGGYILKGYGWDSGLSYRKRLSPSRPDQKLGWNRRFLKPKPNGRRDRAPGARMTYPAIVITE